MIEVINENNYVFFYYKDNEGNIIGKLTLLLGIDFNEIHDIFVEEKYRGKKIGNLLLDEAIKYDNKRILLEVRKSNNIAINLYNKFGFKEISIRKNYYKNEDAIIMERK